MTTSWERLEWPLDRLGEALALLAEVTGLRQSAGEPAPPPKVGDLDRWIRSAAVFLGCEARREDPESRDMEGWLRRLAPGVVGSADRSSFLLVVETRRGRVQLLGPERTRARVALEELVQHLQRVEPEIPVALDAVLKGAGLSETGRRSVRERWALHASKRGGVVGYSLSPDPGGRLADLAAKAGLTSLAVTFVVAYLLKMSAWLLAWWALWKGALRSPPDPGWMWAWALLLLTSLPFRILEPWLGMRFSVAAGHLVKRRLLWGASRIQAEELSRRGSASLLGRALECEEAESLSWSAGILILSHALDLLLALPVLVLGAGGWAHALLLVFWLVPSGYLFVRYRRARDRWALSRLELSSELTESMVGHETLLVQGDPHFRARREDAAFERYLEESRKMDRWGAACKTWIPGGWLMASLALVTPAIATGRFELPALAATLGMSLLLTQSLEYLVKGLAKGGDARFAWRRSSILLDAAGGDRLRGLPEHAAKPAAAAPSEVTAHDLAYRFPTRSRRALDEVGAHLQKGDKVVLQGPSGSGKSTLARLLLGKLQPESGIVLLDGLDRATLGEEGWQQRISAAPQFHANHVFTGTMALNLLMGRAWPPSTEDLQEAETLCEELGLADLIERMPSGLQQMVGETGWQLSQGERSRLFLARALLAGSGAVVLDESLESLDPESALRVWQRLTALPSSVVLIAHR